MHCIMKCKLIPIEHFLHIHNVHVYIVREHVHLLVHIPIVISLVQCMYWYVMVSPSWSSILNSLSILLPNWSLIQTSFFPSSSDNLSQENEAN